LLVWTIQTSESDKAQNLAIKKGYNMIKKYKATIELSFNVLDENSEKITIEHIENKLDEQARDIADYQDAKISITNFYEA
jgi:hypothetical protein